MKNLKRIMVLTMVFVIALTGLTACGKKNAKQLTKDQYVEAITRIYNEIGTTMNEIYTTTDATTTEGKDEYAKKIKEQIVPLFEEIGALNAPDEFKEDQEKIRKGAEVTIEILAFANDEEKLQEKVMEHQQALSDYDSAIGSIIPQEELTTEEAVPLEPTTGEATTAK